MANHTVSTQVTQRLIDCCYLLYCVNILNIQEFEFEIGALPGDTLRMRNKRMRAHNNHINRAVKRLHVNPQYLYGQDDEMPFTKVLRKPFMFKKEIAA